MIDNWEKRILKDWKDVAIEVGEFNEYISECIKELEKRVEDLERHTDIHPPF